MPGHLVLHRRGVSLLPDPACRVDKLLTTLAFLLIPILWGIAVNGLFNLWNGDDDDDELPDDHVFPDYQI